MLIKFDITDLGHCFIELLADCPGLGLENTAARIIGVICHPAAGITHRTATMLDPRLTSAVSKTPPPRGALRA